MTTITKLYLVYDDNSLDDILGKLTVKEMSMENSKFPSVEEIKNLYDINDAADICDKFNVQYDFLETLDEIIERLILEYWRRKGVTIKKDVSCKMFIF